MKDKHKNPFGEPLITAIDTNDITTVEKLLKEGIKPNYRYAFTGFAPNNTHPQILELLAKYKALPKNTSLATLKLVLFAMGNTRIPLEEFWDKPDLNLNGFPKKPTPMDSFVRRGNIHMIKELIRRGVTSRPISAFSCEPSHFRGCGYLEISEFKQRIKSNLAGTNSFLNYEDFNSKSELIMLLLAHPTKDLEETIERETNDSDGKYNYLPFFAWAAAHNKTECLDNVYFKRLFTAFRKPVQDAVVIAAVFSSKEFLLKAYEAKLLDKQDINKACTLAAAQGDNKLLKALVPLLREKNNLPFFQPAKDVFEESCPPMFWAIRNKHPKTVGALLNLGIPAHGIATSMTNESYLQLAARMDDIESVRLLLDAGAELNHVNKYRQTVFDDAKKNKAILQLLHEKKIQSTICAQKVPQNESSESDEEEDKSVPLSIVKYV